MRFAPLTVASLATLAAFCLAMPAAAGDLTPPGAPGPTMKALDIVEPRTPITQDDIPFTIVRSGSYYLTSDLFPVGIGDNIITVLASNVTIDLRGFTIIGATEVSLAADGVELAAGVDNVTIHSGRIIQCQQDGISGFNATSVTVRDVRVREIGDDGIQLGARAQVIDCEVSGGAGDGITALAGDARFERCLVTGMGDWGFVAGPRSVVTNCSASGSGFDGYQIGSASTIDNCTAQANGQHGFSVGAGVTIRGSSATANTMTGFNLGSVGGVISDSVANENGKWGISGSRGATITRCTVAENDGVGIFASADCTVIENTVRNNGLVLLQSGISIGIGDCRVEGNNLMGNQFGITGSNLGGSFIARNTVRDSVGAAYSIGAGNVIGQIFNLAGGANINNLIVGGNGNPPGPWSNFQY